MKRNQKLSLETALSMVPPLVSRAFKISNDALNIAKIPHVLIGGIAVGVHGHQYATKDVDYLTDDELWKDKSDGSLFSSLKDGVPYSIPSPDGDPEKTVGLDYIPVEAYTIAHPKTDKLLRGMLAASKNENNLVVLIAPLIVIVYMKLHAHRPKDYQAVEGLLEKGMIDIDEVREFLIEYDALDVLERFDKLVKKCRRL